MHKMLRGAHHYLFEPKLQIWEFGWICEGSTWFQFWTKFSEVVHTSALINWLNVMCWTHFWINFILKTSKRKKDFISMEDGGAADHITYGDFNCFQKIMRLDDWIYTEQVRKWDENLVDITHLETWGYYDNICA